MLCNTMAFLGEMAHELQDSLKSYGIADKLLGFVADNVSNNDMLTDNLHEQLPKWDGQHNYSMYSMLPHTCH